MKNYKFAEIYFLKYINNKHYTDTNMVVFLYNKFVFSFNYSGINDIIIDIFNTIDTNWKENLEKYITNNYNIIEKKYAVSSFNNCFCFPLKELTEEQLFYFKLKIPDEDLFDVLFSESDKEKNYLK